MTTDSWTVADHLHGKPPSSIALYHEFVDIIDAFGPTTTVVGKTMIVFKGVRRGFAGAKPTPRGLTGYFDLTRPVQDRRVSSATPYTKRLFVHHFSLASPDDLDHQFAGYLREAYEVGQGAHLRT
ncbi:MAG TPA: DUF5655 domain-containing protein [Micromonosporaceae bacterium]|jgi:hypothetical protein|nr:DUF5655 domain-containing protein [Micromonosporaceae bacterium]